MICAGSVAGLLVRVTEGASGVRVIRAAPAPGGTRADENAQRGRPPRMTVRMSGQSWKGAVADGADHRGVAVVEEQGGAGVHGSDVGHFIVGEVKPKMSRFCAIRSGRTDLGMAAMLRWVSQRSTTWAMDVPWAAPISVRVGSENRLLWPSANPPQDSCWTPARP